MKIILLFLLLQFSIICQATEKAEFEILGMTCQFCAYGVQKSLETLPGVQTVQISLKRKLGRIIMGKGHSVNLGQIKQRVARAGYKLGKINVSSK